MQNNEQLYRCLKNSLTASGTANIIVNSTKYQIGINPCGDILLKIILRKDIIDTRSTASNMRDNMSIIYTYTVTVNSDIEKFNEYAKINY